LGGVAALAQGRTAGAAVRALPSIAAWRSGTTAVILRRCLPAAEGEARSNDHA
jgi:hypothetical protein